MSAVDVRRKRVALAVFYRRHYGHDAVRIVQGVIRQADAIIRRGGAVRWFRTTVDATAGVGR